MAMRRPSRAKGLSENASFCAEAVSPPGRPAGLPTWTSCASRCGQGTWSRQLRACAGSACFCQLSDKSPRSSTGRCKASLARAPSQGRARFQS